MVKNHVFHSAITAPADGTDLEITANLSPDANLVIDIAGTSTTRTIDFYGKSVNGNYVPLFVYNMTTGGGAIQTTATTNQLWQVSVAGLTGIRCKATAVSGGNLTITGRLVG